MQKCIRKINIWSVICVSNNMVSCVFLSLFLDYNGILLFLCVCAKKSSASMMAILSVTALKALFAVFLAYHLQASFSRFSTFPPQITFQLIPAVFHALISFTVLTNPLQISSHILLPLLISFHDFHYKFLSFATSIALVISLATSIAYFISLAFPSQISFQLLLALHFISFADFQHR